MENKLRCPFLDKMSLQYYWNKMKSCWGVVRTRGLVFEESVKSQHVEMVEMCVAYAETAFRCCATIKYKKLTWPHPVKALHHACQESTNLELRNHADKALTVPSNWDEVRSHYGYARADRYGKDIV